MRNKGWILLEKTTEKSQSNFSKNNYLLESMRQSYTFWHQIYGDSPVNIPLIWKKALDTNYGIQKEIGQTWKNNSENVSKIQIEQFLDWWAFIIKKSNFKIESKSIREWEELWNNSSDEQFKIYSDILMFEKYWKNIQDKNIE
jgi:hypothetical protein